VLWGGTVPSAQAGTRHRLISNNGKYIRQNRGTKVMSDSDAKIIKTYQPREEVARYLRRVGMAEIEKNDFNLNISRYISAAVEATDIDLEKTHDELVAIEASILAAKEKHNSFLKELGLRPLP
jgi:type I restriction enzyme M protein